MKRVLSVSLGSSSRDKKVEVEILGQRVSIERRGVDGDAAHFVQILRDNDGKVDAFGFGGGDIFVHCGPRHYCFSSCAKLASAAKQTPVLDGSGLKNTLEPDAVLWLAQQKIIDFQGCRVLLTCGVDRYGMAEVLDNLGAKIVFGDLMFNFGLPLPIRGLRQFRLVATLLLPIVTKLPQHWLYPTGQRQEVIRPKFRKYYEWAEVIAGDFLYIRKHLPPRLPGKIILTNTTTQQDVELLREHGVRMLITTTPEFEGRTFGTNVMEAVLVAVGGVKPGPTAGEAYRRLLRELRWQPRVLPLNEG